MASTYKKNFKNSGSLFRRMGLKPRQGSGYCRLHGIPARVVADTDGFEITFKNYNAYHAAFNAGFTEEEGD